MHIIRPITQRDADTFIDIAFHAGIGMTSMPKNREILLQRVAASEAAFRKEVHRPGNENYLFVLEDLKTKTLGGTCGIIAKTGLGTPLFFYRLETLPNETTFISQPKPIPIMRVVHFYDYPTEICSLYLLPDFRHGGLGKLLSLSRFMFIAAYPERFDKMVFAEMRGFVDSNNTSPFWEGIGRHFLDLEYEQIMHLRDEETIDIDSALPRHPIYLHLLPQEVQRSIGKIHVNTQAALSMLVQEGFCLTEEIDVFDGGPKIEAETREIRTIKESTVSQIAEIAKDLDAPKYLISNDRLDFRACLAPLLVKKQQKLVISSESAEALQVQIGDNIRYVSKGYTMEHKS